MHDKALLSWILQDEKLLSCKLHDGILLSGKLHDAKLLRWGCCRHIYVASFDFLKCGKHLWHMEPLYDFPLVFFNFDDILYQAPLELEVMLDES